MAPKHTTGVLGAGGKTGKACVDTLLQQGHSVRAIVRDPSKYTDAFPANNSKLKVVPGDVTDPESLKSALAGCDSLIFAASGTGYWSAKDVDFLGVQHAAAAAKAVKAHTVLVSSNLVTPTLRNRVHPIRILLNNMRWGLMDYKFKGEEAVRAGGGDYTIIRPGGLGDGPAGQAKLIARQGDKGVGQVRRADVAAVCVAALSDPAAKNVTLELVSEKGGEVLPLAQQLAGIFAGLKRD